MLHRRKAELLIVNLRWLALLAMAFLMDERESRLILAAMPLGLFLYNLISFYICSDAKLYQRYNFWPGYVTRALDLLAVTFMMTRMGDNEGAIYLLYSIIIVGAGFVYGALTSLVTCIVSIALFYAAYKFSGLQMAFDLRGITRFILFPASVLVGTYLSREFEQETTRRESFMRLEGIYQLGSSFNERLDINQILHKTVQTALELTYADRCIMTLYTPNSQQVDRQAELTRPGAADAPRGERGRSIVTEFQSQVQTSSLPAQAPDENQAQPAARIETPLSVGTKIVGKLEVESWNPEIKLGGNEAQLLTILATQAAIAIQNARMVEDLQSQAETDPLTGLLNRRSLAQRLAYETQRANEGGYSLTVWIFDLDNFKSINDNYGHPAGDKVLQKVGGTLLKTTRDGDIAVRYGGDEFLVMLRKADGHNALLAVNRVKKVLENMHIKIENDSQVMVSLSGGFSCTSVDGYDSNELIHLADERLLHAKQFGKNKICGPENLIETGEEPGKEAA